MTLVPLRPDDIHKAWSLLPGHVIQHVLHNELVQKIASLREKLESVSPDKLSETQAELRAYKFLLGVLHRSDKLNTP